MADTENSFEQVFTTYKEVKEANPEWSDRMIEDYLSLKRDLVVTVNIADQAIEDAADAESQAEAGVFLASRIHQIQAQIGSGNFLTSDETGFTVDSTKLSVDMDEA